jgi:hypothetical protein
MRWFFQPSRLAEDLQRTAAADGRAHRRRCAAGGDVRPRRGGGCGGEHAQSSIEGDRLAPPDLAIKQGTLAHFAAEHLLQADRLGAELHLVGPVRLGLSALVFDREGSRRAARKFNDVGQSGDAERQRAQRQPAHDPNARPALGPPRIDPLMQDAALGSGAVLRPQALDMDQGALPRAEQLMLQRRQRDQRILDLRARKGHGHSGLTVQSLQPLQEQHRCRR